MRLRVLLAGQEAAGAQILRAVLDAGHDLVAVLTQEPVERGGPSSLSTIAERAGVRVLRAERVRDASFGAEVRAWSVHVLLNAHSLHILSDAVLTAPSIGSFNLHPGPLPEYAGLNTVGWAIYRGESEYGVSVHWMEPEIDAGPIAFQERFPIEANATALKLSAECTRRGVGLLARVLDCAASDASSIPVQPQDRSRRVYYRRGDVPQDGLIDWNRPAREIDRFARAFDYGPFASPWGRPVVLVAGERVELAAVRPTGELAELPPGVARATARGLQVASADEWVSIGRLFHGGAEMDVDAFLELAGSASPGRSGAGA